MKKGVRGEADGERVLEREDKRQGWSFRRKKKNGGIEGIAGGGPGREEKLESRETKGELTRGGDVAGEGGKGKTEGQFPIKNLG